jgi:hypothetical protein
VVLEGLAQDASELDASLLIDGRKGLVEEQETRSDRQGAGKGHALPLTTRERPRVSSGELVDAQLMQQLLDTRVVPAPLPPRQAEGDVGGDVAKGKERVVLRHIADPAPVGRHFDTAGPVVEHLATDPDRAGCGAHQTGQRLDGERFAGPRGAKKHQHPLLE